MQAGSPGIPVFPAVSPKDDGREIGTARPPRQGIKRPTEVLGASVPDEARSGGTNRSPGVPGRSAGGAAGRSANRSSPTRTWSRRTVLNSPPTVPGISRPPSAAFGLWRPLRDRPMMATPHVGGERKRGAARINCLPRPARHQCWSSRAKLRPRRESVSGPGTNTGPELSPLRTIAPRSSAVISSRGTNLLRSDRRMALA